MSVKNFVQCGLVTPVAANTVELVLAAPTASYQYPPLDGGTLVIADSVTRPSFYEIISYTHRIDNVLYGVVRAKEGTTARAWTGSVWVYQALTAQDYVDALALKAALDSPAFTGIPTAPTAALGTNTNQIATMAALKQAIDALVGGAPGALDALNEFAAALGNDPNFATTMTNALAGKEPSIAAGTSAQMWLGNKTWASVLSQVQNTLLTGLGVGSNAPIVSTDTLIAALAKIQNQLNNKVESTDTRLTNAREWTATDVTQAEAEAGSVTVARKWSPLRVWQAVLGSKLTGINLTLGTAVSATDTVLIALGKLQKQITDAATNLAGNVRATVLTGYVTGSNAVLDSTDTVLDAFGKVQAQITGLVTSKLDATANAVSASKLQTARTIGGVAFDGTANINLPGVNAAGNQSTSGNAATATKLQTARTINGVAFDGTANITVADATKLPLAGGNMTGDLVYQNVGVGGWARGLLARIQSSGAFAGGIGFLGNGDSVSAAYFGLGPTYWSSGNGVRVTEGGVTISGATTFDTLITGSVNGNAATATKLATARTINGVAFDGSANITVADAAKLPLTGGDLTGDLSITKGNPWLSLDSHSYGGDGVEQGAGISIGESGKKGDAALHLTYTGDGYGHIGMGVVDPTSGIPAYRAMSFYYQNASVTFHGTIFGNGSGLTNLNANQLASGTIPDARLSGTYTGVNITGNAATATKLATARTIGGVSFDGTANINLPGVNAAGNQNTSGNAATATKLATARTIALTGDVTGSVTFDGTANASITAVVVDDSHNHAISNVTGLQAALDGKAASGHTHANMYQMDGVNTGWFRTTGGNGWYNETYAGGIHMTDSTYVRTYNNKQFLCNDVMRIEGASPQVQLWDSDHSILRYLYADGGSIGFLTSAGGWALMNDNSGNTVSTGNVTAYSDIRLKKDIELIPNALDKVLALRGVTYERIDSGERQTGVIAQEVQAVLPEAVMEGNDEDKTLSVAYGNLVGLLIEAIKELKAEVEELNAKVEELSTR